MYGIRALHIVYTGFKGPIETRLLIALKCTFTIIFCIRASNFTTAVLMPRDEAQHNTAPLTIDTPGLYVHAELRSAENASGEMPIVILIHGFPQA